MQNISATIRKLFRNMLYALLALILVWVIAIQSGCFSMRTPDSECQPKMQSLGQTLHPQFFDIPIVYDRTIHAVAVSTNDSLPLVIMVHGSPGAVAALGTHNLPCADYPCRK